MIKSVFIFVLFLLVFVSSIGQESLLKKFSKQGGVYEKKQKITLDTIGGYTIYFTLDGSKPSSGATKYKSEITIEKPEDFFNYIVYEALKKVNEYDSKRTDNNKVTTEDVADLLIFKKITLEEIKKISGEDLRKKIDDNIGIEFNEKNDLVDQKLEEKWEKFVDRAKEDRERYVVDEVFERIEKAKTNEGKLDMIEEGLERREKKYNALFNKCNNLGDFENAIETLYKKYKKEAGDYFKTNEEDLRNKVKQGFEGLQKIERLEDINERELSVVMEKLGIPKWGDLDQCIISAYRRELKEKEKVSQQNEESEEGGVEEQGDDSLIDFEGREEEKNKRKEIKRLLVEKYTKMVGKCNKKEELFRVIEDLYEENITKDFYSPFDPLKRLIYKIDKYISDDEGDISLIPESFGIREKVEELKNKKEDKELAEGIIDLDENEDQQPKENEPIVTAIDDETFEKLEKLEEEYRTKFDNCKTEEELYEAIRKLYNEKDFINNFPDEFEFSYENSKKLIERISDEIEGNYFVLGNVPEWGGIRKNIERFTSLKLSEDEELPEDGEFGPGIIDSDIIEAEDLLSDEEKQEAEKFERLGRLEVQYRTKFDNCETEEDLYDVIRELYDEKDFQIMFDKEMKDKIESSSRISWKLDVFIERVGWEINRDGGFRFSEWAGISKKIEEIKEEKMNKIMKNSNEAFKNSNSLDDLYNATDILYTPGSIDNLNFKAIIRNAYNTENREEYEKLIGIITDRANLREHVDRVIKLERERERKKKRGGFLKRWFGKRD